MAITTYSELQTAVANWLERDDLTSRIPEFIALAEAGLRRDERLQLVQVRDFTAVEDYGLPSDFKEMIELYLDGSSYYGPLDQVLPGDLSSRKAQYGDTGVPKYFAVIADSAGGETLRFAPEPSGTYTLRMTYLSEIESLSDSITTNWLLDEAPDLYLYRTLMQAEPFLMHDERVALWKALYEDGANEFEKWKKRKAGGSRMTPRPMHMIGADV